MLSLDRSRFSSRVVPATNQLLSEIWPKQRKARFQIAKLACSFPLLHQTFQTSSFNARLQPPVLILVSIAAATDPGLPFLARPLPLVRSRRATVSGVPQSAACPSQPRHRPRLSHPPAARLSRRRRPPAAPLWGSVPTPLRHCRRRGPIGAAIRAVSTLPRRLLLFHPLKLGSPHQLRPQRRLAADLAVHAGPLVLGRRACRAPVEEAQNLRQSVRFGSEMALLAKLAGANALPSAKGADSASLRCFLTRRTLAKFRRRHHRACSATV